MTPVLVLVAVLAATGGVVAVAAQDPRHATLGAFAAVLLAAFVADPMPGPAALAARAAGAVLGGWLTWMALRGAPRATDRSALRWPGVAAVAAAAFAIGWLLAGSLATIVATGVGDGLLEGVPGASLAAGSPVAAAAVAAACALAVVAAYPVLFPRDGHRLGLGVVLLLAAASLLGNGLGAGPDETLELAIAIVTALTGAAIAGVVAGLLRAVGDLRLHDPLARDPAVRHRPADDAHRRARDEPASAGGLPVTLLALLVIGAVAALGTAWALGRGGAVAQAGRGGGRARARRRRPPGGGIDDPRCPARRVRRRARHALERHPRCPTTTCGWCSPCGPPTPSC